MLVGCLGETGLETFETIETMPKINILELMRLNVGSFFRGRLPIGKKID